MDDDANREKLFHPSPILSIHYYINMNASQSPRQLRTASRFLIHLSFSMFTYITESESLIYIFLTALPCFIMDVVILNSGINLFFFLSKKIPAGVCCQEMHRGSFLLTLPFYNIQDRSEIYLFDSNISKPVLQHRISCSTTVYKEYIQKKPSRS